MLSPLISLKFPDFKSTLNLTCINMLVSTNDYLIRAVSYSLAADAGEIDVAASCSGAACCGRTGSPRTWSFFFSPVLAPPLQFPGKDVCLFTARQTLQL